ELFRRKYHKLPDDIVGVDVISDWDVAEKRRPHQVPMEVSRKTRKVHEDFETVQVSDAVGDWSTEDDLGEPLDRQVVYLHFRQGAGDSNGHKQDEPQGCHGFELSRYRARLTGRAKEPEEEQADPQFRRQVSSPEKGEASEAYDHQQTEDPPLSYEVKRPTQRRAMSRDKRREQHD